MTQPVSTYRKSIDKEANAMASNDLEVLEPEAPVEKVMESKSGIEMDRRHFFAAMGVAGVAAGAALLSSKSADAQQPSPNGFAQVDVMNFLLNLKYLKATLYSFATTGNDIPGASYVTEGTGQIFNQINGSKAGVAVTFSTPQIADIFNEMAYDEINQLVALRAAQGNAVAPRQTMNLLGTGTSTTGAVTVVQSQVVALARLLEDLSASAFAFATQYLTGTNLALAAQSLASDGQHAGLIRLISMQTNTQYQGTQYASYATSNTAQTALTFSGSTTSGNSTIYAILPTPVAVTTGNPPNIPAVGNVLTGIGIPPGAGAIVTGVNYVASATPFAVTTKTCNVLTNVSSLSGLVVGMPVTGTNISGGAYITAINTTNSSITINSTAVGPTGYVTTGSSTITGVSSTTGLIVGYPISGTGIPSTATVAGFNSTASTITLSVNATATSLATTTGVLTNGSTTITGLSSVAGFAPGAAITGTGIPANTTIVSATSTTITMSAAATATTAIGTSSFTGFTLQTNAAITGVSSTTGLAVGQFLNGPAIPAGTTIKSISGSTVTMSANATAASTLTATGITGYLSPTITSVSSTTGFLPGASITGTFIPSGATIQSVGTNTITLTPPTVATSNEAAASNIVTPAPVTIFFGGQLIQTPATETVTSPTTETITIGLSTITIAANATVTGVNSLAVVIPDNQDVEPGDPGVATTSAGGPSVVPGTSPAIYQGFFNTAGAGTTGATSTPAGFAFARTFQQVLAVLYGYNSTNNIISTQNYQGGFFPVGVSGPINSAI
jgi:hypothetical protein